MGGHLHQLLGLLRRGQRSQLSLPQRTTAVAFVRRDPSTSAQCFREAHVLQRHATGRRVERRNAYRAQQQHSSRETGLTRTFSKTLQKFSAPSTAPYRFRRRQNSIIWHSFDGPNLRVTNCSTRLTEVPCEVSLREALQATREVL